MTERRSANFRTAMQRSAEARRCPNCDRGAALKSFSERWGFGRYCRYDDCGYEHIWIRGAGHDNDGGHGHQSVRHLREDKDFRVRAQPSTLEHNRGVSYGVLDDLTRELLGD